MSRAHHKHWFIKLRLSPQLMTVLPWSCAFGRLGDEETVDSVQRCPFFLFLLWKEKDGVDEEDVEAEVEVGVPSHLWTCTGCHTL